MGAPHSQRSVTALCHRLGESRPESEHVLKWSRSRRADLAMIHCRKRAPRSMTACSDSTLCCSYTVSSPRSMCEKSTPGNCCSAQAMSLRLSQIAAPA